jgi:hypothetical protein
MTLYAQLMGERIYRNYYPNMYKKKSTYIQLGMIQGSPGSESVATKRRKIPQAQSLLLLQGNPCLFPLLAALRRSGSQAGP